MSHQPFRLVQPLARIFHTTLLRRVEETGDSFHPAESENLQAYSFYDHVHHEEMCRALLKKLTQVHERGNVVLTSENLCFPLRTVRRSVAAVQRFPNTTKSLEEQKMLVEEAMVRDVLRLSTDDVSAKDNLQLWSTILQLSRWDLVEAMLRHFPLRETVTLNDDREYQELMMWVCLNLQSSPPATATTTTTAATLQSSNSCSSLRVGGMIEHGGHHLRHADRFLTDVLGVERVMARCRDVVHTCASAASMGDISTELRLAGSQDAAVLMCAAVAATVRHASGRVDDAFPVSETEWRQLFGGAAGASSTAAAQWGSPGSSVGVASGGELNLSISNGSLAPWCRRLVVLHDPAVPAYVRDFLAPAFTNALYHIYQRRDPHAAALFYLTMLPLMQRQQQQVDVRALMRHHHDRVMADMFWSATPISVTTAAANKEEKEGEGTEEQRNGTSGKRGKWTATSLPGGTSTGDTAAAPIAASFSISAEAALTMLMAEASLMAPEETMVAAHEPAIATLLRIVLAHLRPHMQRSGGRKSGAGSEGSTASLTLHDSLWTVWHPALSGYLAFVLSRFLRGMTTAGRGSSSGVPLASNEVLDNLMSEGLAVLRPLLDIGLIEKRGTASQVTALLVYSREVVMAIGGTAYQAQLRALVLAHVMDGFTRDNLQEMAAVALRYAEKESDGERAATMAFVQELKVAQLRLPLRKWAKNL